MSTATDSAVKPYLRVTDLWWALAAAGAAALVMAVSNETAGYGGPLVGLALLAIAGAPLVVRSRWPVGSMLAVSALPYVYLGMDFPGGAELPLQMTALYSAAAFGCRRATITVFVIISALNIGFRAWFDTDPPLLIAVSIIPLALALALGDGAYTRQRLSEQTQARLDMMEAEREADARAAVAEERAQIARELHDVLAHTITTITVQAGAAADGLPEGPERRALRTVRTTANEARDQLRATLELLRADSPGLPAPVGDFSDLVANTEAAGVTVVFERHGEEHPLPVTVELAAYRIVQEALTNVVRHSHASNARVTLAQQPTTLTVHVTDDGAAAAYREGFGIIGIRERVRALGGTCSVGPHPNGGFNVEAALPITQHPSTAAPPVDAPTHPGRPSQEASGVGAGTASAEPDVDVDEAADETSVEESQ